MLQGIGGLSIVPISLLPPKGAKAPQKRFFRAPPTLLCHAEAFPSSRRRDGGFGGGKGNLQERYFFLPKASSIDGKAAW